MVDYMKILVEGIKREFLLKNRILTFERKISEETGEYKPYKEAKYHHCKIKLNDSGSLEFKGSIHKLWNSINKTYPENYDKNYRYNGFNGNQFNLNAIYEVQEHLKNLFHCDLEDMKIQSIEFGTNIEMDHKPETYVKGFLYHHGNRFEYKNNKHYSELRHQRYHLKIYNKGNQYRMKQNILRAEIKIKKMISLMDAGIKTFADINPTTLGRVTELLLSRIQECVFYDKTINPIKVDKKIVKYLDRYKNQDYWLDELKANQRGRHKVNLLQITEKHSKQIHKELLFKILDNCIKINQLTENQKCSVINTSSLGLNSNRLSNKKFFKIENNYTHCTKQNIDSSVISDNLNEIEQPLSSNTEERKEPPYIHHF